MTTINTIEDLVRILREQPAWAEAVRAVLLTEDLLDLPARFDRFIQSQEETNQRQEETNRRLSELITQQSEMLAELKEISDDTRQRLTSLEGRFTRLEGRFGNFEGAQYEGMVRTKALARTHIQFGFEAPYVALHQEGLAAPSLVSAITHAIRESLVTIADSGDLFETDLIISDEENRHAVFEISLTADAHDIRRAKQRANILDTITGGGVTPVVITARIDDARSEQAEAEGVTVFVIPYSEQR